MKKIGYFSLVLSSYAFAENILAAAPDGMTKTMESLGKAAKYTTDGIDKNSMSGYIGSLVAIFLGLLGVIFVIIFIVSGYNWMMAGGEAAKLDKAKESMWRAIIGLLIVISAYAIQQYVFSRI